MKEPRVRLILFSDLFASFCDGGGSHDACDAAYRRIAEAGIRVVFVSGAPAEIVSRILTGLDPEPEVLAEGDQRTAVEGYIAAVRAGGDIPVTLGIGGSPDDTFLEAVDQAAVIPSEAGGPCPGLSFPKTAYICKRPGQEGWIEWAEMLLRRIDLVTLKR